MPSTPAAASPWRAQLGAFAVDGNARKLWKSLEKKYPKLAARQPYLVKSAKLTRRSEEHTSELQSLMRISYAVFCLKKKNKHTRRVHKHQTQLTSNYTAKYIFQQKVII